MYTYSPPERALEATALPNIEVFYVDERTAKLARQRVEFADTELSEPGWYYWPCFPGCLPDGPAIGPFDTEQLAIEDCTNSTE